jgi:hypothetical protein
MKKAIVTTTINSPTQALIKYITFNDWDLFIVGDKKTPHHLYELLQSNNKNVTYLSPCFQEKEYKELSDAIEWNKIQRRTIGYLHVYKLGYDIIASVDDDNIPYNDWGKDLYINKEIETYFYTNDNLVFDPLSVTNYDKLWHRGFPVQLLTTKNTNQIKIKKIVPKIQANFWNGDPDIDAFCRLEHKPCCFFDNKYFPFSTNNLYTFNQQNTIFSREILKNYLALPFIGRMDDIWASYYIRNRYPSNIVYCQASVYQERNPQDLVKNLENECIGYRYTREFVENGCDINLKFVPEETKKFIELYQNLF